MTDQMSSQEGTPTPVDLRTYMGVLRRRWLLVVVLTLSAAILALVVSLLQTPMYRASAVVAVNPVLTPSAQQVSGDRVSESFVKAQLDLLNSATAANLVADEIGRPVNASFSQLSAGTPNIRIVAESDDPERAALVANTYVGAYRELRIAEDLARLNQTAEIIQERLDAVERQIAELPPPEIPEFNLPDGLVLTPEQEQVIREAAEQQASEQAVSSELSSQRSQYLQQLAVIEDEAAFTSEGRITIIDEASAPSAPYEPSVLRNVLLALLVGLVLGVAAAFVREQFDDSIDSAESLAVASGGLPLLGAVPLDEAWTAAGDTRLVTVQAPNSVTTEAYRTLRTSLQFAWLEAPMTGVQVTSARSLDGKSTTVANLAVTLAAAGKRVLVVDLDLRRPRMHRFFGLSNDVGFTTALKDPDSFRSAVAVSPDLHGLEVLTSGPRPANPSELLASPAVRAFMQRLYGEYDLVLVDSSPVLGVSDPLVIADLVDATVVVARSLATTKGEVRAAVDLLRKVDAPLVGTVVNSVDSRHHNYYGYGYYGYAAGYLVSEPPATVSASRPVSDDAGNATGEAGRDGAGDAGGAAVSEADDVAASPEGAVDEAQSAGRRRFGRKARRESGDDSAVDPGSPGDD